MAYTDKNIVITPNIGSSSEDPQIVFSGANSAVGPQNITLTAYPLANGTLSVDGSAGQLFSITNQLTGTLFSVNDVSGIPMITANDAGSITLVPFYGSVGINTAPSGTYKLEVSGSISGSRVYSNGQFVFADRITLNDISNQFNGLTAVFNLRNDQSNVTNSTIQQSVDLEVILNGRRLAPYIKQNTTPWITPYDSFKGFRVVTSNTASQVIIYNAPAIGDQADITIINSSSTVRTRKYPYSATTIALGD